MKLRTVLDIIDIMRSFLPPHLYALDFSNEHYLHLLRELEILDNHERFEDKKGTLKKAIIDYFESTFQSIDVEVSQNEFKIVKHFLDSSKNEAFDRILHANALKLIAIADKDEEYRLLPFLLSIPFEIRQALFQTIINSDSTIEKARFLTREQVEKIFKLNPKDIILFLRGKISIRIYTPQKPLKEGSERRFNGDDPAVLERLYQNYFPQGAWTVIEEGLDELLAEKLNFSVINNLFYRKNFIPVFRFMVEIILTDVISVEDRQYVEGLTGYILRQHFDKILYHTAENLLLFVENRDKNAQNFIKDYSDDIVVDANGKRIQKYAIIDAKQQTWNTSSIISLVMQYKQIKVRMATQQEAISTANDRLEASQVEMKMEKKSKEASLTKMAEIEATIAHNDIIYVKSKRNTDLLPDGVLTIQEKRHKELLEQLKKEKSTIELINNRIANKSIELTRRHKKIEHEEKVLETLKIQTAPIIETFNLMTHAVAVVLAKR